MSECNCPNCPWKKLQIKANADLAYAAGKIEGLTGKPDEYLAKILKDLGETTQ